MPKAQSVEYKVSPVCIYRAIMPQIIASGLRPGNMEDAMRGRLEGKLPFSNYCDTVDGIAYAGNNKDGFKIVLDFPQLIGITPETKLHEGGIILTPEQYDEQIHGQEFTRKDTITGRNLTLDEALAHQGWLKLARNEQLLEEYVASVFRQEYDRFKEREAMGFYIREPQKTPILRAFCLGDLDDRSFASGYLDLNDGARLFGVRESAEGARAAPQAYTPEDVLTVLSEGGIVGNLWRQILEALGRRRG